MALRMARMLDNRFAWLSTTPFGSPVLPDVYWIKAVAVGSSSFGSATVADVVIRVPTLSIALNEGTSPRSRPPSRNASGTVTSTLASALRKIPACRRK